MNSKIDRQADWQTERREKGGVGRRQRQTDKMRQTQRDTDRPAGRERDIIIDRQTGRERDIIIDWLIDTQSERARERERERDRQTDRDAKIRLIMTSRLTQGENGRNVVQRSSRKTLGMQYEK